MGGESRGRRRGVAASGWREGRAGFCRAAASLSSRPSLLPAALKPGLAKLGVALTPSQLARPFSHVRAACCRRLPPWAGHLPHSRGPIQAVLVLFFALYSSAKASLNQGRSDPPGERTDQAPLITLKIPVQVSSRVQCRGRRTGGQCGDTCRVTGQSLFLQSSVLATRPRRPG